MRLPLHLEIVSRSAAMGVLDAAGNVAGGQASGASEHLSRLSRDRWFESISLLRRVNKLSVPLKM